MADLQPVEILVEEPSASEAIRILTPKILGGSVPTSIRTFAGKHDLLRKLPVRLRGYANLPTSVRPRVLVLVDRDGDDCRRLKGQLDNAAIQAGLSVGVELLNRIVIEELEAWFFGDPTALRRAYPKIPSAIEKRASYRDPDAIKGGTWEALERVLKRAGYHRGGLPKIEAARAIAVHMDPGVNRSRSFQMFRDGLKKLAYGRPNAEVVVPTDPTDAL